MKQQPGRDGLAQRAGSLLRHGWARTRHLWRSSLGFRVVVVTMLLGLLVMSAVGTYLYGAIAQGLVDSRQKLAAEDSLRLAKDAQRQILYTDQTESIAQITQFATELVKSYRQDAGNERRYVVLSRTDNNTAPVAIGPIESNEIGVRFIPSSLRQAVSSSPDRQHLQVATIDESGHEVSAVIVGQQVDLPLARTYGLYSIYPMDRERQIMGLIGQTFLFGAAALILLVGAVAFVVTRLVADPVRRAARIAERFADGNLGERMRVKGEDDLARLANSFNAMAASLQQQIGQLENLSRVQQRFVSDVSHELRTPLTTIRMAGDLIHDSRSDFDPAVARSAELLRGELDRFESLLSDLLEISRFDAGAAVLEIEATDLRLCVDHVVDAHRALAERKGSELVLREPAEPVVADMDSRRIERILRNLVSNAIEHGEGHAIEITLGQNDSAVAVTVRDHGIGLRPGEAALVFTRFWRADPARARTTGGTGLGLAIALEDARLHAGRLEAWGAPGQGSCFRLTLPKKADSTITGSPLPLTPLGPTGALEPPFTAPTVTGAVLTGPALTGAARPGTADRGAAGSAGGAAGTPGAPHTASRKSEG
ncbi:MAG: MtrAB system histidine kinase MtrB [Intrasporangium sp.]|uniref:MtrAB system histidine kinase MtrB n=1 Tax=Intrasporangium sp. TaxID=1925024 RepID=UPI003F808685